MKKIFKYAFLFLIAGAMSTSFSACSSDDNSDPKGPTGEVNKELGESEDSYLAKVLAAYTDITVNPTYASMAVNATDFFNHMKALRDAVDKGNATQEMVNAACESWKKARADYESSEAFLLGAASDYNIDPHIDTWPLDLTALHSELVSPAKMARYTTDNDEENINNLHNDLNQNLLGFHAVEFIIFRDGAPRKVASFSNTYDDYQDRANFTDVKAIDELKYGVAVAGDLMYSIYQLEVCWSGQTKAHKEALENLEWKTTMPSVAITYSDNMKNAGKVGSLYTSVKNAVSAILTGDGGAAGIADEVGQTKMGKPYGLGTNDENKESDPNYIESPFSYNSLTDFFDNIQSIDNIWNGGFVKTKRAKYSFANYFAKLNPTLGKKVQSAIDNAQAKIKACPKPFVKNYKNAQVLEAINACTAVREALEEANTYIGQRKK